MILFVAEICKSFRNNFAPLAMARYPLISLALVSICLSISHVFFQFLNILSGHCYRFDITQGDPLRFYCSRCFLLTSWRGHLNSISAYQQWPQAYVLEFEIRVAVSSFHVLSHRRLCEMKRRFLNCTATRSLCDMNG